MKIRINPLTVVMIGLVTIIGSLKLYIIAYSVMGIHELAHLVAAKCIGLSPDNITFSPFGVHLRLSNKIIGSITDEIILYSVGPLVNAVLALIAIILNMSELYRLNFMLFLINILPVMPLDGGMIAVRLLSCRMSRKQAMRILNIASGIIGASLLFVSLYLMWCGRINISLFILAVFLIGNILTSREMYDSDLINAMSVSKKRTNKANILIIDDTYGVADAIRDISPAYTTIAVKLDDNGKIKKVLTEKDILNNIDISA